MHELLHDVTVSLIPSTLLASSLWWMHRRKHRRRALSHGDALSLLAITTLSHGRLEINEDLLQRLAEQFALVVPQYATPENAATILDVLEVCEAVELRNGMISLTHRGLHMRLRLAKGEPTLGLAAAFERKHRAFTLREAA